MPQVWEIQSARCMIAHMAIYKYQQYLNQSTHNAFDSIHSPGAPVPFSGVYRCEGCNKEVAANEGQPLPPQNHHQHTPQQGTIRWRLVVYAVHDPQ
jgi:hypothetical protein